MHSPRRGAACGRDGIGEETRAQPVLAGEAAVLAVLVGAVVWIKRMHLVAVDSERGEEREWRTTHGPCYLSGYGL
jgi:hypothetical protein